MRLPPCGWPGKARWPTAPRQAPDEEDSVTEKLVLKKYDPVVRKHVDFKEGKIK